MKNTTQHTPGPLLVEYRTVGDEALDDDGRVIGMDNITHGFMVVENEEVFESLYDPEHYETLRICGVLPQLFAAAPELLDAVKSAKLALESAGLSGAWAAGVWQKCADAIQKAEGTK